MPRWTHADPRLARWLAHAETHDRDALRAQLAENAVFHSPVVHTPQQGRDKTFAYLDAAGHVFADADFDYKRLVVDGNVAVLEFTAAMDGIHINGVDMIEWNDAGEIIDFKVMVRPLKAVNMVWQKMGAMLAKPGAA
jgi:hypothetical protein